jgi:hypothetical protein
MKQYPMAMNANKYYRKYYSIPENREKKLLAMRIRKLQHDLAFYAARGWKPPAILLERLASATEGYELARIRE